MLAVVGLRTDGEKTATLESLSSRVLHVNKHLICDTGTLNALDNPDEDAYQNITVFKELGQ